VTQITEWESAGNVHVSLKESVGALPRHKVIARLAVKYGGSGAYLDIGCGLGDIPALVRKLEPGAAISVADAYQRCLDATVRKVPNLTASYLLSETDFRPDTVIKDRFEVVTMSHVLEHLHDPISGLRSVLQLLKPGGFLILAVPNPSRPQVLITNIWRKHYVNRGHAFAWDPSHWRNFLERIVRLNVVEYATDVVGLFPGRVGRVVESTVGVHLARVVPWWGFSNIAVISARTTER
jgi:2-polyprenyl-3-methyl-5-hydroxy-6-metoxy-1,4-benzoquinol methylase